jgi:acyl carrier protein
MTKQLEILVCNLIADTLEIEIEELTGTSSPDDIDEWDSVKHVEILLAVEEEFLIKFTEEKLVSLWTVDSIVESVGQERATKHISG